MSELKKGLFTFDTLKDSENSSIKNYVILMNLSKNYSFSERERIKIFNPENKKKFKYIYTYRNSLIF